jgi:zinc/manganese transport system permease protein
MVMSWWVVPLAMALLTGLVCPLSGTLLLVNRRLLQGNLISHAVLPGLALAVALGLPPALGGILSGLLGTLLAERLIGAGEASDEAVLNTVLAGFLGLGVLLIPILGLRLDLEAILFGDLLLAGPADLLWSLLALTLLLLLLSLRHRALVYVGVDPIGAAAMGLPVRSLRLQLAFSTAFVVVSAMTAVGVILVIGLMCAPALLGVAGATSLRQAALRSALVGLLISGGGFALALALDCPPGPLIGVLCMGLLFLPRKSPVPS